MTGGSGATGCSTTWPGWPVGWASPGVRDERRAGPPAGRPGRAGAAGQPGLAQPAAAPGTAARPRPAGLLACPGDGRLPGRGLGRRAGHRQHRTWAAGLAVRPRRRRAPVTGARLLVDPAEFGAVGI